MMLTSSFATLLASLPADGAVALPLPSPDPLGYPLPPILLSILAYFTLTLHFLAMNLTVGSVFLYLWLRIAKRPHDEPLAKYLGAVLPLGVSYLITFGVPPLLFLQVLYGQMFYSSSILLGFHWILVIPLIVLLYGVFYYQKLTKNPGQPLVLVFTALAAAAMLTVGFFYVNNITLSVSPEKWLELYHRSPGGANLNLGEPTLFARWMLFLVPGFTVAGVAILFRGTTLLRWGDEEQGRYSQRFALRAGLLGMLLETAAGAWMIATLPEAIRSYVMSGGLPTMLLGAGVLLALVGVGLLFLAQGKRCMCYPILAAVAFFLALSPLVVLRDLVRQEYLRPFFRMSDVPVNQQWGMFGLFVGFLVVGLGFLVTLHILVIPKLLAAGKAAQSTTR